MRNIILFSEDKIALETLAALAREHTVHMYGGRTHGFTYSSTDLALFVTSLDGERYNASLNNFLATPDEIEIIRTLHAFAEWKDVMASERCRVEQFHAENMEIAL